MGSITIQLVEPTRNYGPVMVEASKKAHAHNVIAASTVVYTHHSYLMSTRTNIHAPSLLFLGSVFLLVVPIFSLARRSRFFQQPYQSQSPFSACYPCDHRTARQTS